MVHEIYYAREEKCGHVFFKNTGPLLRLSGEMLLLPHLMQSDSSLSSQRSVLSYEFKIGVF